MPRGAHLVAALSIVLVLAGVPGGASAQVPSEGDPFPGPEAVQDRLDGFAQHPWVSLHPVGTSVEDRPIRAVEAVDPDGSVPVDQRPVTLVLTQQHGDEPAGTPAALRLLDNITAGAGQADWLDDQVLLVLPMVNPDGSQAGTRENADGVDINRDHIALDTPEARAVHETMNRWDVDVALDMHEYGGTGAGNPVPVRIYDHDVLTLFPRHGNVRAPTLDVAKDLMYEGIWPEVREAGYSVNEYGEMTVNDEPVDQIAGGPDPGILRNHYGLHNVAGLLVETRIDQHPNPFHPPERRIQAQTVVVEATLEHVHEHADRFVQAKEASRQLATTFPADEYVEGGNTGELARAYLLPNRTDLVSTMQRHGIEPGLGGEAGFVHDTWHPLQGHAAAIFHPDSSRTVVEGTPTDLDRTAAQLAPASTSADETPLNPLWVLLGLAGAVLLPRRPSQETS